MNAMGEFLNKILGFESVEENGSLQSAWTGKTPYSIENSFNFFLSIISFFIFLFFVI